MAANGGFGVGQLNNVLAEVSVSGCRIIGIKTFFVALGLPTLHLGLEFESSVYENKSNADSHDNDPRCLQYRWEF